MPFLSELHVLITRCTRGSYSGRTYISFPRMGLPNMNIPGDMVNTLPTAG